MNSMDTSDDALNEWWDNSRQSKYPCNAAYAAWQECRRRCDAQMEERERKAIDFVIDNYCMIRSQKQKDEACRAFKEGTL